MRKSEHTELATLSRLAVYTSVNGLQNLSYGNAAKAAHLSRGALQRLFPDSESMHLAVIGHVAQLLDQYIFQYDRIEKLSLELCLRRWTHWICGESGLPGGCVLLAVVSSRGYSAAIYEQAHARLLGFLQRLQSLTPPEPDRVSYGWLANAAALHALHPWIGLSEAEKSAWLTRLA